jgi:hypothetical protein
MQRLTTAPRAAPRRAVLAARASQRSRSAEGCDWCPRRAAAAAESTFENENISASASSDAMQASATAGRRILEQVRISAAPSVTGPSQRDPWLCDPASRRVCLCRQRVCPAHVYVHLIERVRSYLSMGAGAGHMTDGANRCRCALSSKQRGPSRADLWRQVGERRRRDAAWRLASPASTGPSARMIQSWLFSRSERKKEAARIATTARIAARAIAAIS